MQEEHHWSLSGEAPRRTLSHLQDGVVVADIPRGAVLVGYRLVPGAERAREAATSDLRRNLKTCLDRVYDDHETIIGTVIAHQTFGDMLRWNPHFHAIVLEGGLDEEGAFFYIPFSGLQSIVEVFRRRVIKLLVERNLLNKNFARNLLSWKHSGFSIDSSVRILDESSQQSLAEYIARPPISPLRVARLPHKGALGRDALGCGASAGRLEGHSSTSRWRGRPGL